MPTISEWLPLLEETAYKSTQSLDKPTELIAFTENKDASISAWIVEPTTAKKSKLLFKFEQKKKKNEAYVSIMIKTIVKNRLSVPMTATAKIQNSSPDITYLLFENESADIPLFIEHIIIDGIAHFQPSDMFGCCHRYLECSQAKKCIHPDQFYSLACWYRKNLEAGKVFY